MEKISGSLALGMLLNLVQLAYAIVMSLFANYLYKQHVIKTIRSMAAQPGGVTGGALAARGGTSVIGWIILGAGVLVLGVVMVVLISQYLFSQVVPLLR